MIKKGFDKEANDLGLSKRELTDALKDTGMFNPSGSPKAKYVKDGTFTSDGDIRSPKQFEETLNNKLDTALNFN